MEDCFGWWATSGTRRKEEATEKLSRQISMQVATRREDVLHANLSVKMAKDAAKAAFIDHGQTSSTFVVAVTRFNRERTRERACTNVLKQLEDAQHMMQMKEMTKSALLTLRLADRATGGDNLDVLLDTTDNEVALAEEAKTQIEEIANCFAPSGDLGNMDALLLELGLEPTTKATSDPGVQEQRPKQPTATPQLHDPMPSLPNRPSSESTDGQRSATKTESRPLAVVPHL
jgi:hypothetical protein